MSVANRKGGHFTAGGGEFTAGMLQATLTSAKVAGIVALAWDGPQLQVFSVALGLGERPERIEALAGALALAAGAETCRVSRDQGRVLLEIPKPAGECQTLKAGRLDELTPPAATAVALGIATGGKVLWHDLASEAHAHTVIGGTTGSGKTVLLRWLVYRLCAQNSPDTLRLLLFDPKRFELSDFTNLAHLLHPIESRPLEIARVLAWVTGELDRRSTTGQRVPRLVLVIEEVADLVGSNPEIGPALARVAQIGRALGIHLLATTQQPGSASLGKALINIPARIVGRVASATLTYGATGRRQTGADALLGRGDFLLVAAGQTTRFQAPLATATQFRKLTRTAHVASLADELPTLMQFADLARDPRGGPGRRELSPEDYQRIEGALADGANPDALRAFGIGYTRARRLHDAYGGSDG